MAKGGVLFTSTLVESLNAIGASSWTNVRGCDQFTIHTALGTAAVGQLQASLRPSLPTSAMAEVTVASLNASGFTVLTGPYEWLRFMQNSAGSTVTHVWVQGRRIL